MWRLLGVFLFVFAGMNVPAVYAQTCNLTGDTNCDGQVNALDLSYVLSRIGTSDATANIDRLGSVNSLDIVGLIKLFGSRNTSPSPIPSPSAVSNGLPSGILNLINWKITLPIGSGGKPAEIKQPALASYKIDPWFVVQGNGVRFRAPVNGYTTSNSSYPRSELREMNNNGSTLASWSTSSGKHSMYIDQMVTLLPKVKSHLVVGQIHDSSDDVTVFRVEGSTLWITKGDSTHGYAVDTNFQLNKRFTIKFEVQNNVTRYYYNGNLLPYVLNQSYSGAYFKAGAYTQANCGNSSPCSADNYGEVVIYDLQVSHQ